MERAKTIAILVIGICLVSTPSFGLKMECATFYSRLASKRKDSVFSEEALARIAGYFDDPNLDSAQAAQKAFDEYVNLRLADLPPDIQTRLRQGILNTQFSPSWNFNGSYNIEIQPDGRLIPDKFKTEVLTPYKYRQSLIAYSLQVHELEHAIQRQLQAASLIPVTTTVRPVLSRILTRETMDGHFFLELGAMRAEWDFLQSIPSKQRMALVDEIAKDFTLSKDQRDYAKRVLEGAGLTQDQFIAGEHAADRYSKLQMSTLGDWRLFGLPPRYAIPGGVATYFFGMGLITDWCLINALNRKLDSKPTFVQDYCKKLPSVQAVLQNPPLDKEAVSAGVDMIMSGPWWYSER
jgi:hypothetical protein